MISASDIGNWLTNYWWIIAGFVLFYIYEKYNKKESVLNLKLREMIIIAKFGFFFILIVILQKYLFFQHHWFLIMLPPFIFVMSGLINYILSQHNVYMIETAFKGEKFFNPVEKTSIMALTTRIRLIVMDKSFYETKQHIGETLNPLWDVSKTIKFCNYYDDNTGIFYHSEYPQLQNINFYACVMLWLKLKEEMPKLMKENLVLTWLNDINVAHGIRVVGEDYKLRLKGIKDQLDNNPFTMPEDFSELLEYAEQLRMHDTSETKSEPANLNSPSSSDDTGAD